jgi:hypothetical protein
VLDAAQAAIPGMIVSMSRSGIKKAAALLMARQNQVLRSRFKLAGIAVFPTHQTVTG